MQLYKSKSARSCLECLIDRVIFQQSALDQRLWIFYNLSISKIWSKHYFTARNPCPRASSTKNWGKNLFSTTVCHIVDRTWLLICIYRFYENDSFFGIHKLTVPRTHMLRTIIVFGYHSSNSWQSHIKQRCSLFLPSEICWWALLVWLHFRHLSQANPLSKWILFINWLGNQMLSFDQFQFNILSY